MVACVVQWLKVLDVQEDVVVLAGWVGALSHNLLQGFTHTHLAKKAFGVAWWIGCWVIQGGRYGVRQDGR